MIKEYQGSLKPTVAKPPIADAEKVTRANNKKIRICFLTYFYYTIEYGRKKSYLDNRCK